jgi:membrane-bound ClpP family serine protease
VRNFIWFFFEFFSITLLIKTFFVPFNRLEDNRKKKNAIDLEAMAERLVVNVLMRIVGALLRLVLITLGIIFILTTIMTGVCFTILWLLAPLMLTGLVFVGSTLLAIG